MQNYVVNGLALWMGIIGIIGAVVLVILVFMFGKIMKHQWKLWLFAKRGYTQIRHVREDMVENYYFLRIKNEHFNFNGGIYMEQKDVKTKTKSILAPLDYKQLSKKPVDQLTADEKQILSFLKSIEDSKVMDITTLSWGIPTITYFGNNPNPVNIKEIKKVYDAKNIAAMIKRILMTKEWKFVRMVLILCLVSMGLWLVLAGLDYGVSKKASENLGLCLNMLNQTTVKYNQLLNETGRLIVQNSTMVI